MHIVFQKEITRGQDIRGAIEARGWTPHEIITEEGDASLEQIERTLFKAGVDGKKIMTFGSILVAKRAPRRGWAKLDSGIVAREERLRWSSYATHLPNDWLLNPFGILFPWGYLKQDRTKDILRRSYGEDGVFIRPNSPWKPFAGFPTSWEHYDHNIKSYQQLEHIDPGEICVLLPRRHFDPVEWRFWVVAGQIATYAPYSWEQVPGDTKEPPEGMIAAVERAIDMLEGFEEHLVIDMAHMDDGFRIVELNGLSTSGFYDGMDVGALLDALPAMFGL
jgi:hypothetical protein